VIPAGIFFIVIPASSPDFIFGVFVLFCFILPVHENDAIAKPSVTHTPDWNGFRKDADGRVLEVDASP
jgi:hypothetical protein